MLGHNTSTCQFQSPDVFDCRTADPDVLEGCPDVTVVAPVVVGELDVVEACPDVTGVLPVVTRPVVECGGFVAGTIVVIQKKEESWTPYTVGACNDLNKIGEIEVLSPIISHTNFADTIKYFAL